MRKLTVGLLALATLPLMAEDFPDKALVVSQQFIHTTAPSNRYTAELQIGQIIYIADDTCNKVKVGQTYPAKWEKHHLVLQAGEKVCKYRIVGQRLKE